MYLLYKAYHSWSGITLWLPLIFGNLLNTSVIIKTIILVLIDVFFSAYQGSSVRTPKYGYFELIT